MELDKYQQAWKFDAAQVRVSIDTDLLTKEMQRSRQTFRSNIFWRDARELGFGLLTIPIWIYLGIVMALPWSWYLEIPAAIWVIGFVILDRRRHPQKVGEPGESLLHCSRELLAQVEHQIWLLRNVFWWYLLPSLIAIMTFFVHVAWRVSSDWWMFLERLSGPVLIGLVVNIVVYLVNRLAIHFDLEPRRQELLNLVVSLEEDENSTDSKDVIAIVSKLADPTRNFTWEKWADNWNNTVPSWRVAGAILVPTLVGACCGLYSGLWIRIPEMGPVLFQTVVGAVIPSDVAFFSFMYLASRRKKKRQVASAIAEQDSPASGVAHQHSRDQTMKQLPGAPALVILLLILFLSLMAVPAIISFFMYFADEAPLFGKVV